MTSSTDFGVDIKNFQEQEDLVDDYNKMKSDWEKMFRSHIPKINAVFSFSKPKEEEGLLENDPIVKFKDLDLRLSSTLYKCNYKTDNQKKSYLAYRLISMYHYNLSHYNSEDHLIAAIDTLNYLVDETEIGLEDIDYFTEFIFLPYHLQRTSQLFVLFILRLTGRIEKLTPQMVEDVELSLDNEEIPIRFLKQTVLKDSVYVRIGDHIREVLLAALPLLSDLSLIEQNLQYSNQLALRDYHHVSEEDIFRLLPDQININSDKKGTKLEEGPVKMISTLLTISIKTTSVRRLTIITWYILNMVLDYTNIEIDKEEGPEILAKRFPIETEFQNRKIIFRIAPENIKVSDDGLYFVSKFNLVNIHPIYFGKVNQNLKLLKKLMPRIFVDFRIYPRSLTLQLGPDSILEKLYDECSRVIGDQIKFISTAFLMESSKRKSGSYIRKGGYIQRTFTTTELKIIGLRSILGDYSNLLEKFVDMIKSEIEELNYRIRDEQMIKEITDRLEFLISQDYTPS